MTDDTRTTPLAQDDIATEVIRAEGTSGSASGIAPDARSSPAPAPTTDGAGQLAKGVRIKDRFVIEGVLGRGGMGVVYAARDLRKEEAADRDPYVALKVLGESFRRDRRMMIAMQREARKAQTLAHPNIATVYDFDRDGELVFLTMELLQGDPLDAFIRKHPEGVPVEQARHIIRGLCLGLAYAHNKGIVHSDFKPGNVFLSRDNRTRILDFGIARAAPVDAVDETSADTQFDAGTLGALTPAYASCEMFEGAAPHPADDVYALAVVCYQLLTGRHPFAGKPAPKAREEGLAPQPVRGLKRREWRALERALAFDRGARSDHAAVFLREFEGSPRIRQALFVVATALVLSTGYLVYQEVSKRAADRPEIAFAQLDPSVQQAFEERMAEGDQLRRFSDYASALSQYQQAYELHPRNPQAVAALEGLFTQLEARTRADANDAGGAGSQAQRGAAEQRSAVEQRGIAEQRQVIADNLAQLRALDAWLANRPALKAIAARLERP
ncbi:MAG: serine/threonine-protein kinase [Pseudomonadota bacterium]